MRVHQLRRSTTRGLFNIYRNNNNTIKSLLEEIVLGLLEVEIVGHLGEYALVTWLDGVVEAPILDWNILIEVDDEWDEVVIE